MIVVEILAGIIIALVVITGIMKVAAPIADAFSERLKLKFKELEPEKERQFQQRLGELEEQIRQLKLQVADLQEATSFNIGIEKSATELRVPTNKPKV